MDENKRPDPDQLLKTMEAAEEKKKKGTLRIFFGYAAGIGKTYSMLRSARKRKEEGIDVVIGYLEPHARPETTALAEGLEQIPVKTISYNTLTLKEMDIDAIMERRPQLVLVDEYAHTNAIGSRHEKRYQDVEELLEAGIDVYTTVNVQHIESLCDIVASITGIIVRERIPDHAFDMADEVKIVDIEPQILMKRLAEGKVYRSEQASRALNNFFTVEKLTALREITLRRTADRVNLLTEQTKKEAGRQYYTEEKILVGISPSPSNAKIIRTAARMAQAFGGRMIGLYVETPNCANLDAESRKRLKYHLQLAEQLGAKIETVLGEDVPFILAEYAKNAGISKIIAGRSMPQKGLIKNATFVDKLTMYAPDLDIYIIPDHHSKNVRQKMQLEKKGKLCWNDVFRSIGCLSISTLIGFFFYEIGLRETDIVTFIIFFAASIIISNLVLKMKMQSKELVQSAYRTKMILEITQILQKQTEKEAIGKTMAKEIGRLLRRSVVYYDIEKEKLGKPEYFWTDSEAAQADQSVMMQENEKTVAGWVLKNIKCAGAATDTLHNAACYYLPVHSLENVYGVIGIRIGQDDQLSAFEQNMVTAIIYETATVIERENLRKKENALMNEIMLSMPIEIEEEKIHIAKTAILHNSTWIGKKLWELNLPKQMIIGCILRGEQTLIPRGDTVIKEGDTLITITSGQEK